ncbi:MAG: hypothetical protein ACXWXR_02640 [Candidatus Limnocylindrales bacterium]
MSIRAAILSGALGAAAWLVSVATALAATPAPSVAAGGDPRSSGQGPGLVGDPAFAILAVLAIGLGAVLLTLAYLRLTTRPRG